MKSLLLAGLCATPIFLMACGDDPASSDRGSAGGSAGSSGGGTTGGSGGSGGSVGGGSGGGTSTGGSGGTGGSGVNTGGSSGAAGSSSSGGDGGSTSSGGTGGSSGGSAGSGGTGGGNPPSGLPVPPGPTVPKPSGTPGNLTILDWAGFKGAVSYTFDDSLASQTSNYVALNATGVRMTFYVVSNNNGSNAVWSQAVADGHEIGNHTAHHCRDNGTGCAWGNYAGSLVAEFEQCSNHIMQQFGQSGVWTSASPYGDKGFESAAQNVVFLNRGVQGGQVAPKDSTNPFALPCFMAHDNEPLANFNAATDSARSSGKWQLFLIHSLGGDGGYAPIALQTLLSSIDHAKSLGDVWIDSVVNVGAYWRAQKIVSAVTPVTSGSEQTWSWTLPDHFPPGKFLRVRVDGGTLSQNGTPLVWDEHGYYEVALDAGSLTLSP